jgi:hypothetical protein
MFDEASGGFYNEFASGNGLLAFGRLRGTSAAWPGKTAVNLFRRNPAAGPSSVRRETIPFPAVPFHSAGKRASRFPKGL